MRRYVYLFFLFFITSFLLALPAPFKASIRATTLDMAEHPLGQLRIESKIPEVSVENVIYLGEDDKIRMEIENAKDMPITAWSVAIRQPGNPEGGVLHFSEDYFKKERWLPPSETVGLPGKARSRIDVPVNLESLDRHEHPYVLELSLVTVVFEDTTYSGSGDRARRIFEERARGYSTLVLLERTYTGGLQDPLVQQNQILENLAGVALTMLDKGEGATTEAIRNLPFVIEATERPGIPSTPTLESWALDLAQEKQTMVRHTPSVYLRTETFYAEDAFTSQPRRQSIPGLDLNTDSCDILASRTTESEGCSSANGNTITIKESWSFVCQPFDSLTGSGTLTGNGSCLAGTECWPFFSAPITTVNASEGTVNWNRTVTDMAAAFPTTRCVSSTSRALDQDCPCPDGDCLKFGEPTETLKTTCDDYPDCPPTEECPTPILLDLTGNGFLLTGLKQAVEFDIDADGERETVSWTAAGSDEAFLALDRNTNGQIDHGGELFGNVTSQPASQQPNGFLALAVFDQPDRGGLPDGQIDSGDAIFDDLILWRDANHDGVSQPEELRPLSESNIQGIGLDYFETRRRDRHGNQYRWSSWLEYGEQRFKKLGAVDVILVSSPE